MKRLVMAMLVIAIGTALYAQNIFFPAKAGMVLTYANNDARGNTESYSMLTIKNVTGSGRNMTVTYVGTGLDKNRRPVNGTEMTYQVVVRNGVVVMDINQLIPAQTKEQGVKMDVKGTSLELPDSLQPGQSLKDYQATITMDLGVMKMDTVIKVTDGKCLAIEDVRVPAGTFKCHKITQKFTTTAMGINSVQTVVTWYAPNIGQVKTETYDANNRLVSGSVLAELKGN